MNCHDRISGETFFAADEAEIREYLAEALNAGETVAYDVVTDDGELFSGGVTGDGK